jgi:hypothetical protein
MSDDTMTENRPQGVTQAGDTPVPVEASHPAGVTPSALTAMDVNAEAANDVERERNMRIERERKVPYIPPEVPPGLSPNQKIALHMSGALPPSPQHQVPADKSEEEEATGEQQ